MSLSKNELIKGILDKPTIFICGEDENLSKHSVQQLLILKMEKSIEHLYFIKPQKDVIEFLEEETTNNNYTIVQNVEEINNFSSFNIIVCGIKVDSKEFIGKVKIFKNKMVIFFRQLSYFRKAWEKLGTNIFIKEQCLDDFICDVEAPKAHFSEPLHKSQRNESEFFFTNRGRALDLYRNFKADKNKRCCIIIGVRGMGKRTFIKKLKISGLINYVDHYCIHKNDDLTYILRYLLGRFNVQYKESEIPNYLDLYKVDPILKKLFSAFDRQKNSNLIFYDVDIIYDKKKRRFYDPNLSIFFKHLLQRPSYCGNKIYFTSEYNLIFTTIPTDTFQYIYINAMTAEYIRYILEYEFGKPERDSSAYATAIMQFEDKIIDKLIGGFPPIAHIFVNTCTEYSMEDIINRGFAYSRFEENKLKELKEFIKLEDYEIAILSYLSLFRKQFTVEAAIVFQGDASIVLEHLIQRMLLEKVRYVKHTTFYVPSFIQDYILSISDDKTIKANHNKIGDYYWETAESKKKNYFEQLEDYRNALYHYEAANNTNKKHLLMTQFTGIFLNTAYELYTSSKIEDAYSVYELLYDQGSLTNERHLNYFLICNAKLNKEKTRELFDKVAGNYSKNIFIQNSYANYLYMMGDYNTAEKVCSEAIEIDKNNYVVNNLYAKIINKKGEKERAFMILDKVINKFQSKIGRSFEETEALLTYMMTSFSFVDYVTTIHNTMHNIALYLKHDGMTDEKIEDLFTKSVPDYAAAKIIASFEKAINHKKRNKIIYSNYANFLKRQGKHSEANEILIQGRQANYSYKIDLIKYDALQVDLEQVMEPEIQSPTYKLHKEDLEQTTKPEIQPPTRKLHKDEVQDKLRLCNEKIKQAQAKLNAIFVIESDNYQALSAQSSFFQEVEYLKIFLRRNKRLLYGVA